MEHLRGREILEGGRAALPQSQQGLMEEPGGAGGTEERTGAGPGDTHIIVVAHVHPTVQHHVLASDGHQDAAPAHVLASTWTPEKHQ